MTGTGRLVTFVLRAHEMVKERGLRGEWMSWMREKDRLSDRKDRRRRWLGGGYQKRWEWSERWPLDMRWTDPTVVGRRKCMVVSERGHEVKR